jgi:hypothetical protein
MAIIKRTITNIGKDEEILAYFWWNVQWYKLLGI